LPAQFCSLSVMPSADFCGAKENSTPSLPIRLQRVSLCVRFVGTSSN
jgi:hypothetical protein